MCICLPNASVTNTGNMFWSVSQRGSLYVETLDRVLEKYAATVDLVKMLTKVSFSYYYIPVKLSGAILNPHEHL